MYYLTDINWYVAYAKMPIPADEYFAVAMPGTLSLLLGIYFPNSYSKKNLAKGIIKQLEKRLANNTQIGWTLIGVSLISTIIGPLVPGGFSQFFYLGRNLLFVGLFYLFFSSTKGFNWRIWAGVILVSFGLSVYIGMFGDFIFWSIFLVLLTQLKKSVNFPVKILFVCLGAFGILLIQSVKFDLRNAIWYEKGKLAGQSPIAVFAQLASEKLSTPEELFSPYPLSRMVDRSNQGYLTAFAIRHTPAIEPFAEGETIFKAILASLIPRLLWPDKPTAGGAENIQRFTGLIKSPGVSYNIAPLGDAYVNFGITGGAGFLFLYGLFFNWLLGRLFSKAQQIPTLILWFPLIFFAVVVAETDVVTTFNHTIKALIFMVICFSGFKIFLKIKL